MPVYEYTAMTVTGKKVRETVEASSLETAKASAKSGEPMLRAMEYEFPGLGAERITDQFMLGSKLLVAPQTVKGAKTRKVFVPTGTWVADDGTEVVGPKTVEVATPISRLPHFVRK